MSTPKGKQLCVICGSAEATTRDHIPPKKAIFQKPLSDNLITVPACDRCNNGSSVLDAKFKVYLGMHVAGKICPEGNSIESEMIFSERVLPSLKKNRKLNRKILNSLEPVEVRSPGGIIVGKADRALWDSEAHDSIIERMIRGLYWHHYKAILGDSVNIKVQWLKGLNAKILEMSRSWSQNNVGKAFIYKYVRAPENPLYSLWIFQFYGSHWASGYTRPKQ